MQAKDGIGVSVFGAEARFLILGAQEFRIEIEGTEAGLFLSLGMYSVSIPASRLESRDSNAPEY